MIIIHRVLLVLLVLLRIYHGQSPQNWIYSPQYSYIVYSSGQQSGFSKIRVSQSTGHIFISAGDDGIIVLDPTKAFSVIAKQTSTENVQGFASTDDGKYIYMSTNLKLTVYQFQNSLFSQVGQAVTTQSIYITDILINKAQDTLYVFQINGNVSVYDITIKTQPVLIGNILWKSQEIYGGFITDDDKYLLLCQDISGLGIIALTKSAGAISGILVGQFSSSNSDYSNNVIITTDNKYLINIDYRRGLSFADFTTVTSVVPGGTPQAFSYFLPQWWPSEVILPSPASFCLSSDNKFLFLGVKSIGIYTIDISNINSPITYSWSYFPYHANSIVLSPDTNYIYFSNSYSFMAFRKTVPSLGQQYVNMYNGNNSIGFNKANTEFYWRCDIDQARQVYIGAFDTAGLWLIDVSNSQILNTIKTSYFPIGQNSPIDVFYTKNNYQIMVVPINDNTNFLAVLDTSDYNNIIEKQRIPLGIPFTGYIKDMDSTLDNTMLVAALDRVVVFVDIVTFGSYFVKTIWTFQPSMKGFTTGVTLSSDAKYFIGACRGFGYYVLDIQDLTNIKMVSYLYSDGAEQVYKSLTYSYQYYLIDGLQGLYIMDQSKLPNFVSFSQVEVSGYTNDITFLNEEKTVIISTTQQGMIYLLDISNNKNPFIVSSYQYGIQNGLYTCAKQDFSNLFINNNKAVRSFPLSTKVYIHTDYLQILGYTLQGQMLFNIIDNPDSFVFQVGQIIKLNMDMLYQPLDLIISNVYLIQKQIQYSLPTWIVFNPVEISIVVTIDKNAIDHMSQENPLLNTIVIKTIRPLYQSDFLFTTGKCKTNAGQSVSIYSQFQSTGIIDSNSLVSPSLSFNDQQQVTMSDTTLFPNTAADQAYNTCLSNLLKITLLNSIQYTPIYLMIYPSLKLTIDGSTKQYISTLGTQVSIQLQISTDSGIFIFNTQDSIVIQINEERNIVNMTGLVQNLNEFLVNKIFILPTAEHNFDDIIIEVSVTDSINYPMQLNVTAKNLPFVAQKKRIYLNPDEPLQSQFTDYVYILTQFSFSLNAQTFIIPDVKASITYNVTQLVGDENEPLSTHGWLQYSANSYLFYGTPPQSAFQTSITINVTGSDGFTYASDTFTIHVTKLPLIFLFQWIVTVVGIITGTFGLYKYRDIYYNMMFKKRNRYSTIICKPQEPFTLKVPLVLYDQMASVQVIKELEKVKIEGKKNSDQIKFTKIESQSEANVDFADKKEKKNDSSNNQNVEDVQKSIVNEINKRQQVISLDITTVALAYKKKILLIPKATRQSPFESLYLNPNGSIDTFAFLKDVLESDIKFTIKDTQTTTLQFKEQLLNEYSTFSECLLFQLARKLLQQDQKSFTVYSFLRFYSEQIDVQLTKNDWYKHLVNMHQNADLNIHGHVSPFPQFSLRFSKFMQALNILGFVDREQLNYYHEDEISDFLKESVFDSLSQNNDINLYLIEKVLFADSAGIKETTPSSFFPSCGESVFIDPHDLRSIEAFKYSPGGMFSYFKKALGLDYTAYGPQRNMQLPTWVQLDMQPGLIIMTGIPDIQNVEEVLIRFYTVQGYIIRHFILRVEEDIFALRKLQKEVETKQDSSKKDGSKVIPRNSSKLLNTKANKQKNVGSTIELVEDVSSNDSPNLGSTSRKSIFSSSGNSKLYFGSLVLTQQQSSRNMTKEGQKDNTKNVSQINDESEYSFSSSNSSDQDKFKKKNSEIQVQEAPKKLDTPKFPVDNIEKDLLEIKSLVL